MPVLSNVVVARITEFGQRLTVTPMYKYYLMEHAEVIISKNALDVLTKYV